MMQSTRSTSAAVAMAVTVIGALVAVLVPTATPVGAQGTADWVPPYCGEQPLIRSVFDHTTPGYSAASIDHDLRLYSGSNLYDSGCAAYNSAGGPALYYDGHDGWDFPLNGGVQGCNNQRRDGVGRGLVYAAHGATASAARWVGDRETKGYGLHIVLDRPRGGERSLYGHLAAMFIDEGDPVAQGQVIGAVGTTGNSTGPHLHWAASRDGSPLVTRNTFDPYGWNRRYDASYEHPVITPTPAGPKQSYPDPHRGDGWSERKVVPGTRGTSCPVGCYEEIVEEDQPCCTSWIKGGWQRRTGGGGIEGDYRVVKMSGQGVATASIRYFCLHCPPGTYLVEAYLPRHASRDVRTHIARYEVRDAGTRVAGNPYSPTTVDQHEDRHTGRWIPIGVFHFPTGFPQPPQIEINNRSDRYDFTESASRDLVADALKFTLLSCPRGGSTRVGGDEAVQ